MNDSFSKSYAEAGVDVTAGYESVRQITPLVESTYTKGVLGSIGGFGGMFELTDIASMRSPVTVSGTDGVGTKLKIAFLMDKHDTIGIDCVAMCVNDIACAGAKPQFFLDYLAMGKNIPRRTAEIVKGIAAGCRTAGCALIGGETAEMPGFYPVDEYDLAGFSVGLVDKSKIVDGRSIKAGDALIGFPSSGLHSNGFSLVRKILEVGAENIGSYIPELSRTLGEELLEPTRIYVPEAMSLVRDFGNTIKGMCHITGGGFYENIPRMLPQGLRAQIDVRSYPLPPIFEIISRRGKVPVRDMYNTFNMGIGFVAAVPSELARGILMVLQSSDIKAYVIGSVEKGDQGVNLLW